MCSKIVISATFFYFKAYSTAEKYSGLECLSGPPYVSLHDSLGFSLIIQKIVFMCACVFYKGFSKNHGKWNLYYVNKMPATEFTYFHCDIALHITWLKLGSEFLWSQLLYMNRCCNDTQHTLKVLVNKIYNIKKSWIVYAHCIVQLLLNGILVLVFK